MFKYQIIYYQYMEKENIDKIKIDINNILNITIEIFNSLQDTIENCPENKVDIIFDFILNNVSRRYNEKAIGNNFKKEMSEIFNMLNGVVNPDNKSKTVYDMTNIGKYIDGNDINHRTDDYVD